MMEVLHLNTMKILSGQGTSYNIHIDISQYGGLYMKFAYAYLIIILLVITSCRNVQKGTPNIIVQPDPAVVEEAKKQCLNNEWLQIGTEIKCVACPANSKVNETKTMCICGDKTPVFNAYDNNCRKKLKSSQIHFLLQ